MVMVMVMIAMMIMIELYSFCLINQIQDALFTSLSRGQINFNFFLLSQTGGFFCDMCSHSWLLRFLIQIWLDKMTTKTHFDQEEKSPRVANIFRLAA